MVVLSQKNHTLRGFEHGLTQLRGLTLTMASITQRNLESAYRGLLERDSNVCKEVIKEDDEVDELERDIDREGIEIITRYAPVASNLRRVLGSMRIATDLERISDQAVNIAKRARKMNRQPEVTQVKLMETLFQMALDLVSDSMRAFTEKDTALAESVIKRDPLLDDVHDDLIQGLTEAMEENPLHLRTYLHLIFVARFLERVGDHAENVAEQVIFMELGTDVRHQ